MKTLLITKLEAICPGNVYLQGTLSENDPYPSEFITFWTNYTADRAHYNNAVHSIDWTFSVMIYATDPDRVKAIATEVRTALKAVGFIPQGRGHDLPSDEPTHTGWAMEFIKTEILQGV